MSILSLALLGAAAAPAAAAPAEPLAPSSCPAGAALPHPAKRKDPPPPGIPLLGGVATGMSPAEVRRLGPWLAASQPSRNLELVDGIALRANVNFWGKPALAVSVEMRGTSGLDRVIAALSRHYGRPLPMEARARWIDSPIDFSGGTTLVDTVRLKWCDGPRRIVLSGERDSFWVTVAGRDF